MCDSSQSVLYLFLGFFLSFKAPFSLDLHVTTLNVSWAVGTDKLLSVNCLRSTV